MPCSRFASHSLIHRERVWPAKTRNCSGKCSVIVRGEVIVDNCMDLGVRTGGSVLAGND